MEVKKVIEIRIDQETLREILEDKALEMGYQLKGDLSFGEDGVITVMADEYKPEPVKEVVDFSAVKKSKEQPEKVIEAPVAQETNKLPSTAEEIKERMSAKPVVAPKDPPWTGLPGYSSGFQTPPTQEQNKAVQNMLQQFEAAKAQYQQSKENIH